MSTERLYTSAAGHVNFSFMGLKNRVEKQLDQIGKTKSWLAEQLGVERQNVNNWLSGARARIPADHLFRVARLLNCDAEWLQTGHASHNLAEPRGEYGDPTIDDAVKVMESLSPDLRKEALQHLRLLLRVKDS